MVAVDKNGVLSQYVYGSPKNPDSLIQFSVENDDTAVISMKSSTENSSRMAFGTSILLQVWLYQMLMEKKK